MRATRHDYRLDADLDRPGGHNELDQPRRRLFRPGRRRRLVEPERRDRHRHRVARDLHATGEPVGRPRPVRRAHPRRGVPRLARRSGNAADGTRRPLLVQPQLLLVVAFVLPRRRALGPDGRQQPVGGRIELGRRTLLLGFRLRLGLGLAAGHGLDRQLPAGRVRAGVEEAAVAAARLPAVAGARHRHRREPVELAQRWGVVNSVARTVSGAAGRLRPRPRERHEGYVCCTNDGFWFRPTYTEGKCPLCGEVAPGGAPPLPRWRRMDRSWLGVAGLTLESLAMLTLVLLMYFKG